MLVVSPKYFCSWSNCSCRTTRCLYWRRRLQIRPNEDEICPSGFHDHAGLKLTSIASYNHLGNNDGKNLSAQKQFRSKEISKSNVVDDMVEANSVLYEDGERPDHTVVIKYMPAVGDSKRALDEYYSEIFMGGHQTIS